MLWCSQLPVTENSNPSLVVYPLPEKLNLSGRTGSSLGRHHGPLYIQAARSLSGFIEAGNRIGRHLQYLLDFTLVQIGISLQHQSDGTAHHRGGLAAPG